jgi:hypothetical protein
MLGLCALVLAGCAMSAQDSSQHTGARPGMGPGSLAEPTAVPVADPCMQGPVGCEQVGAVDVDGDGVADRIGIAMRQQPNEKSTPTTWVTVRVATVTGTREREVSSSVLPGQGRPEDVLVGAFSISRSRGADLVLHTSIGQGGSDRFVVLGWSGNDLAPVPPVRDPDVYLPDRSVWELWESAGSREWVTCSSGGSITLNSQHASSATGGTLPGGGILELDHWTFVDGSWSPAGSESVANDDFPERFDSHTDAFKCEDQLQR